MRVDWLVGSMMVQPYLASVETGGERSLIYFNGEFSHAVRRSPVLVKDAGNPDKAEAVNPGPDEAGTG